VAEDLDDLDCSMEGGMSDNYCKNCGKPIANAGRVAEIWWHIDPIGEWCENRITKAEPGAPTWSKAND